MSLYSEEDERRIRSQAVVREWTKSGLLDAAQGAALAAELRVDVRRTNGFLRAGLALFTAFVVGASVTLVAVLFDVDRSLPMVVLTAVSAVACFRLAQMLVVRQRFYRFGVEEALAIASAILIAISAAAFADTLNSVDHRFPLVMGLLAAAAAGLGVYGRFGYVYAAIGALACVAAMPFQLDLPQPAERTLAAVSLAIAFGIARAQRSRHGDEYPGDDYALLQAAAWAGLYLVLNLQLMPAGILGAFYWFTYALIWILPIAGLYLGIRDKDRALLDVSLLMTLSTLLTSKAYLGWTRHEWDPIVLGIFLIASAIAARRWLSAGAGGQRNGFTASRILSKESGAVTMLGTASAVFHPKAPSFPEAVDDGFKGGRSGGGGATGTF